jgi:hypothetical protein
LRQLRTGKNPKSCRAPTLDLKTDTRVAIDRKNGVDGTAGAECGHSFSSLETRIRQECVDECARMKFIRAREIHARWQRPDNPDPS